jgi:hypothetical protein
MKKIVLLTAMILVMTEVNAKSPKWKALFNGKDLAGWTVLGGDVKFYPGHGPASTIGHEILYNPFITEVLNDEVSY